MGHRTLYLAHPARKSGHAALPWTGSLQVSERGLIKKLWRCWRYSLPPRAERQLQAVTDRDAKPATSEPRLAALHALGVLDTQPEERFDRLTRLASALFQVPWALVSLIDRDRQWLKSCHGCPAQEISREMSFCAAIVDRAVMVVPDALLDPRFADHPQVTSRRGGRGLLSAVFSVQAGMNRITIQPFEWRGRIPRACGGRIV